MIYLIKINSQFYENGALL